MSDLPFRWAANSLCPLRIEARPGEETNVPGHCAEVNDDQAIPKLVANSHCFLKQVMTVSAWVREGRTAMIFSMESGVVLKGKVPREGLSSGGVVCPRAARACRDHLA